MKKTKKLLVLYTENDFVTNQVTGSEAYIFNKPTEDEEKPCSIGAYNVSTVAEAIADGFNLLSAPMKDVNGEFKWWLVKKY